MRNIYIFDIIKIRKSALFVSIIGTFFIGYILFYVISFIGAEKILEEMPAELLDIHEKELGIIVVSLNPSISFLTMMKTGIAYAIPLVISIPFSLLHSNEWELKTIKILTSYKNKMNIFFKQMSISIFLTYLLVVITAYLNKVLSVLMWNKLIHKYGVLKDSHIINVGLKTYVMLLLIVLLTAVMYFSLGYILTYSFGTSIPFVVAILGNSIKNDLWTYLPASLYKLVLDYLFKDYKQVHILKYMLELGTFEQEKSITQTFIHPVTAIYLYVALFVFLQYIISRKKAIY